MFSGLDSRTSLRSFGNCTGMLFRTTGTVIRKMISSTSITSTSGVGLIVETAPGASSPPGDPTFIAMALRLRGGGRRRQQHGVELGAEAAHRFHHRLVAADQPVVAQHRG